jgi:drug/metabolite transporter (DMT)-like permease
MKPRVSDLTAISLAILGFTFWVFGDSCVKWIAQLGFPPYEIVAFMGLFMSIALAAHAALRRNLSSLRPHSLTRQVLRSMLDMANNVCVVIALRHLSLTMFYILVFLSPIVISLLSRITLGEPIGLRKAAALVIGFAGVVIAVAPWNQLWNQLSAQHHAGFQHFAQAPSTDLIGIAACMVCVSCFSVNMVWSRVLTRTEHPESLAFCSGIVTAVAGFALCGLHARPLTPSLSVVVVAMGVFCAGGTLCFYLAVKHTSAGNVSQYHYTQLLTGTLVSWLVWRDKPSPSILIGGALIIASGIFIALEAHRNATLEPTPAA